MMLGMLLLAIWLMATGLVPLLKVNFAHSGTILSVLAVAAGILILLGRYHCAPRRNRRRRVAGAVLILGAQAVVLD